jgi:type I restriction enzyme S subunit
LIRAKWPTIQIKALVESGEAATQTGPFGTQLKASDYVEHGTPVINVRNIGFGSLKPDKLEYLAPETVDRLASHLLRAGDIVFGRKGAVERHVLIRPPQNAWFQGSDCLRLRITSDRIDSRFVSYFLLTDEHKQWMINQCSHGATMASLNQDIIGRITLPLPPVSTQRKIASILSAYDDLIENNTRRIAILEEMAQSLYRDWFVEYRFPGSENARFVDSPLGKIPEGWSWCKLKDLCASVSYGYTASANKDEVGPRFLRITDIVPDTIDWDRVPYCKIDENDAAKYALREGDVVIARTGATTGYAKRLHKRHPEAVFASYLVRIVPDLSVGKHYIGLIAESSDYKAFVKRNLSGSAQPQANAQVLTSCEVREPPPEVIAAFDDHVEALTDQKETLQVANRNLRHTRDLLLPKLMSGQLDVEDLDIDTGETLAGVEA